MSRKRKHEILDKVADLATLAGIRGEIDDERDMFVTGFQLPDQRSQMVYVKAMPEAIAGKDAVCIYSPCRLVKTGFMRGITKDQALELLKLNDQIIIARYGVQEAEGKMLVTASVDRAIDALGHDELQEHFMYVALAADSYEKKFGVDEF